MRHEAQGSAGPSTAGSSGLDVVILEGSSTTSPQVSIACPSSHPYLIGGGGGVGAPGVMQGSFPYGLNGSPKFNAWEVVAGAGLPPGTGVNAYVVCSK